MNSLWSLSPWVWSIFRLSHTVWDIWCVNMDRGPQIWDNTRTRLVLSRKAYLKSRSEIKFVFLFVSFCLFIIAHTGIWLPEFHLKTFCPKTFISCVEVQCSAHCTTAQGKCYRLQKLLKYKTESYQIMVQFEVSLDPKVHDFKCSINNLLINR